MPIRVFCALWKHLTTPTNYLLEMQTVIKQAIISEVQPTLLKGSALPQKHMIKRPKNYK